MAEASVAAISASSPARRFSSASRRCCVPGVRNPSASSALLPDCGFGNRVGREYNRGGGTGLHHHLPDWLLTREGRPAAVVHGKAALGQIL